MYANCDRKETVMRTSTQTITIEAPPEEVFELVADLEQLPSWAIGFAKGIRRVNGTWLVRTGNGEELPIRLETTPEQGVVDFWFGPPGAEVPAATRVIR